MRVSETKGIDELSFYCTWVNFLVKIKIAIFGKNEEHDLKHDTSLVWVVLAKILVTKCVHSMCHEDL